MIFLASGYGFGGGGIQVVVRLAYEAVAARTQTRLIMFGSPEPGSALPPDAFATTGKAAIIRHLLFRKLPAGPLLVMHPWLLKLLPFISRGSGPTYAMLYGIDAWSRQGWLHRRAFARVDKFFTISDYTWSRFVQAYPEFRGRAHETIPLGIDDRFESAPPPCGPVPAALILGRLSPLEDYKGHRELIAAWPLVREAVPGAELWVAGDGDLRTSLEQAARTTGVRDAVKFQGRVNEERKRELIAASRCMAMPSRGEGFGLVYLEAMRLGRPCLCSTLDAGREVVNPPEAGLAADMDDPRDLAAAVVRLLTPGPEWDRWSADAKARYERLFTSAAFQERFLEAVLPEVA